MDYIFEDCVSGIIETAAKVEVEKAFIDRITAFVSALTAKKAEEKHHIIDNRKETKRFTTGFLGEAALEKVLGIPIIDWTIGDSDSYHIPDVPGYKVGIKTVEYGKFPIVFKKNYYPQIICIVDTNKFGTVYVCGIASPDVLNKYQDDDLILDSKLKARGTKTGFYGFDYLEPVHSIVDIEMYKKRETSGRVTQYANKIIEVSKKKCPKCNSEMLIKNGRYGQFWGCTGYPNCRYTENA